MFYDNLKEICKLKGITVSALLAEIGRASGNVGNWKVGRNPRIDIVQDMADYLHVSTDEIIYGVNNVPSRSEAPENADDLLSKLPANQKKICSNFFQNPDVEWLEIISRIPEDRQQLCKDFLRTHMVIPDKYQNKKDA